MNTTKYQPYNGLRGPSPNLWADLPGDIRDMNVGVLLEDDFLNFSQHISDQSVQTYDSYIDAGVTMKQMPAVVNGIMQLAGNSTDNDEAVLSTHGPVGQVSDTAGDDKKMWFEARIKKASIANNALAVFIGLAFDHGSSVPVAKTLCLTDDDANLGAFSYLGFHTDQADGDALDFVYKAEGQAQTVALAGAHTWVANTYVKLGFKFDPDAIPSKRIKIYVDGVEAGTYVTGTNIAAATFPDAEPLGMVFCGKVGAAAESKAQLDWWRFAQLV